MVGREKLAIVVTINFDANYPNFTVNGFTPIVKWL
jgi:hypothetical protein